MNFRLKIFWRVGLFSTVYLIWILLSDNLYSIHSKTSQMLLQLQDFNTVVIIKLENQRTQISSRIYYIKRPQSIWFLFFSLSLHTSSTGMRGPLRWRSSMRVPCIKVVYVSQQCPKGWPRKTPCYLTTIWKALSSFSTNYGEKCHCFI